MKYLPLLLILTACGPKFKAGDCIARADKEVWEDRAIYQILQVGKSHYLTTQFGMGYRDTDTFLWIDEEFELVSCPEPEQPDSTKLPWKDPRPR
jgi:hypothetical protein